MKQWRRNLLFTMLSIIVFSACQMPRYPPVEDLLVHVKVFPSDWHADPDGPKPDPSAPFGGIKSIDRTTLYFNSRTAGAFETVERYKDSRTARDEFNHQKESWFTNTQFRGPFEVPEELPYKSKVANHFHFACWRPENTTLSACFYLAQYGPFLVLFNLGWDPDTLTVTHFEKVLQAIDDKMSDYADK
jgi:hypothetical protein